MIYNGLLATFPKEIRFFIATFVVIIYVGFLRDYFSSWKLNPTPRPG